VAENLSQLGSKTLTARYHPLEKTDLLNLISLTGLSVVPCYFCSSSPQRFHLWCFGRSGQQKFCQIFC